MYERLVPKEYRELLDFISPAAFQVIDVKQASKEFLQLIRKSVRGNAGVISPRLDSKLLPQQVNIVDELCGLPISAAEGQLFGDCLLKLFFGQLYADASCILDLRSKHFRCAKSNVQWRPSSVSYRFQPEFRKNLLSIYEGYYFHNKELMLSGMRNIGLARDLKVEDENDLLRTLQDLFGDPSQPVKFDIEQFKSAFHELFVLLKRHKTRLPTDFLFLGIYLLTLYQAMSPLGTEIDVKSCFKSVYTKCDPACSPSV